MYQKGSHCNCHGWESKQRALETRRLATWSFIAKISTVSFQNDRNKNKRSTKFMYSKKNKRVKISHYMFSAMASLIPLMSSLALLAVVKRLGYSGHHLLTLVPLGKLKRNHCYHTTVERYKISRVMRKPAFCVCENKGTDQLCGYRTTDQHICFCYIESTILLIPKSEISSF